MERFPDFVTAREALIREKFQSMFDVVARVETDDEDMEDAAPVSVLADVEVGRGTFDELDWELFVEQGVSSDQVKLAREIGTRVNEHIPRDWSWQQTGWVVRCHDVSGKERVAVAVSSAPRILVNATGYEGPDPWPQLKGRKARSEGNLWWGMAKPELVPDDLGPIGEIIRSCPPRW